MKCGRRKQETSIINTFCWWNIRFSVSGQIEMKWAASRIADNWTWTNAHLTLDLFKRYGSYLLFVAEHTNPLVYCSCIFLPTNKHPLILWIKCKCTSSSLISHRFSAQANCTYEKQTKTIDIRTHHHIPNIKIVLQQWKRKENREREREKKKTLITVINNLISMWAFGRGLHWACALWMRSGCATLMISWRWMAKVKYNHRFILIYPYQVDTFPVQSYNRSSCPYMIIMWPFAYFPFL